MRRRASPSPETIGARALWRESLRATRPDRTRRGETRPQASQRATRSDRARRGETRPRVARPDHSGETRPQGGANGEGRGDDMASFPAAGCVRGSPTWADESASAMGATPRETDGRLASIAAAAACRGVLRRAVAATSSGCAQRRAREAGDALFLDSCRETMRRRETMRHLHIGSLRHRYGGGGVPPGRAKRAHAEVKGRYSGARSSCPTTRIEAHRRSDGTRARRRATKRQRRSSSLRRGRQLRASVDSSCEAASTRRDGGCEVCRRAMLAVG